MTTRPTPNPCRPRTLAAAMLLACGLLASPPVHAQGCSQCRESIGQTPQRTQQAYRRGIEVLIAAAASVFVAGVILIRRHR